MQQLSEQQQGEFENLISQILNSDNQVRLAAEAQLRAIEENANANLFFQGLIVALRSGNNAFVRQFCAVVLRRKLGLYSAAWEVISPDTAKMVQNILLQLLMQEPAGPVQRSVTDAVGVVAARCVMQEPGWPELLPTLNTLFNSPDEFRREAVFLILDIMSEMARDFLIPHLDAVGQMVLSGLASPSLVIAVSSLRVVVSLMIVCEESELQVTFKEYDVMGMSMGVLQKCYEGKDDDRLQTCISLLGDLLKSEPQYLRNSLGNLVDFMFNLALNDTAETGVRLNAVHFLMIILQRGGGMARNVPEFAERMIKLAFFCITQLDQSQVNWIEQEEEEDDRFFFAGRMAMPHLADGLGTKVFTQLALPTVSQMLTSQNWNERIAAIETMQYTVGICVEEYGRVLQQLVESLCVLAQSDPIRAVRQCAIACLAQFATELHEHGFQAQFGQPVLAAFIAIINSPNTDAQFVTHTLEAITDFLSDLEYTTLAAVTQYTDLVQFVHNILNSASDKKVLEAGFTTMAALATVGREHFQPCYNSVMTLLMEAIEKYVNTEYRSVSGRAIECLGNVMHAVGQEVFAEKQEFVIKALLAIHMQIPPDVHDDTLKDELEQCLVQICEACMVNPETFIPYLDYLIPGLLKTAAMQDEVDVTADGEDQSKLVGKKGYTSQKMKLRFLGEKHLTMNVAMVEDKTVACNKLSQYAEILGAHFFPYVEQTVQVLTPLMGYRFQQKIKEYAAQGCTMCLVSAVSHMQFNGLTDTKQFVRPIWEHMFEPLLHEIQHAHTMEVLNKFMDNLHDCLQVLPFRLREKEIDSIFALMSSLMELREERREERLKAAKSPDFDEEAQQVMIRTEAMEDDSLKYIHSVIMAVAKNSKKHCFQLFHGHLFARIVPLLDEKRSEECINAAMCIIDDIIEHCGPVAFDYVSNFFPFVELYSKSSNYELRHSAVYGIGACAKTSQKKFLPYLDRAVAACMAVVQMPNAREGHNEPATDDAVSALGKIMRHVLQIKQQADLMNVWINYLPLNADIVEGQYVLDDLCFFLENRNKNILKNPAHMAKAIAVFTQVCDDEELVTEELQQRIFQLLVSYVLQDVEVQQACAQHMPPELQGKLEAILVQLSQGQISE